MYTDTKNVVIIGAGGHAKVVADIVLKNGDRIVGFLDGGHPKGAFVGYPILGSDSDYKKFEDCYFIIAIGNAKVRERIALSMGDVKWYTAIHPSAIISKIDTTIGEGTVVMANTTINSGAHIGNHCIINSNSTVEHDNIIDDYVHISVGAKVAGTVCIGKRTWVGIGATISNNLTVCHDCMIGAGAVVVKDIAKEGTYIGVPAHMIRIPWYYPRFCVNTEFGAK